MVVVVVRGVAKISKRGSNLVISVPKNDKDKNNSDDFMYAIGSGHIYNELKPK